MMEALIMQYSSRKSSLILTLYDFYVWNLKKGAKCLKGYLVH